MEHLCQCRLKFGLHAGLICGRKVIYPKENPQTCDFHKRYARQVMMLLLLFHPTALDQLPEFELTMICQILVDQGHLLDLANLSQTSSRLYQISQPCLEAIKKQPHPLMPIVSGPDGLLRLKNQLKYINHLTSLRDLERMLSIPELSSCPSPIHHLILHEAIFNHNRELFEYCVTEWKLEIVNAGNYLESKLTALMYILLNHQHLELAIRLGASVNMMTTEPLRVKIADQIHDFPQGITALWIAMHFCPVPIVINKLIEYGAIANPPLDDQKQVLLQKITSL